MLIKASLRTSLPTISPTYHCHSQATAHRHPQPDIQHYDLGNVGTVLPTSMVGRRPNVVPLRLPSPWISAPCVASCE
jgi:hypothetical protein